MLQVRTSCVTFTSGERERARGDLGSWQVGLKFWWKVVTEIGGLYEIGTLAIPVGR